MIPSADTFRAHKWKMTSKGWYKLGVEIIEREIIPFDSNSSFISICFYFDSSHRTYAPFFIRSSNTIESIEKAIKSGVHNILQHKSCSITPKLKRTLKNWIINDST